ncbi:MAG: DnaB-like helicase C-terminal domain-containing protein [Clostridium sp.]
MKNKEKFQFLPEVQLEILRFIVRDKEGGVALMRIKPSYLTLIEHSLIAQGLLKFYKKSKRIPSEAILKQSISDLLETKDYVDLVTKDDVPNIMKIITNLYKEPLRDSEIIKEKIYQFSAYVEMKNINESFDLDDFTQYDEYSKKIAKILQKAQPIKEDVPLSMVEDTVNRQFERQSDPEVVPCPFKQLNDLTNGGGYPKGSVIVLLDKAKAKKTFTLINIARGYLKMRKNVLYIDTENGKAQIMGRMVQSTLNKTKMELQSGEYDKLEQKHMRKYKRLGVDFIVERAVALNDDCDKIKDIIHKLKSQGITIHVLFIDYAGKLAAISKSKDDFDRISDVYIDIQNLALDENLDAVYTAQHVTREGSKHKSTRYEESDISGAISIVRNAQCIIGLNSTNEEEENNVQRMEIVVQRDGKPSGRALFNLDVERQRMVEFTREQRATYDEQYGNKLDSNLKKSGSRNPIAKETDKEKKGDI